MTTTQTASTPEAARSENTAAWSPLRHPFFRAMWIAVAVSNVGTWMQNAGAAWLMTSLAPSPTLVALVQSATALPMFLLALPAGTLADVVDRRRLLVLTQAWILAVGTALAALSFADAMGPWLLLALTFAIGLGNTLTLPAWQALIPDLVPESELPKAVSLNGVSINVARAVGPALAGVIIAAMGPPVVFLLNAASVLGLLVVAFRWQPEQRESELPPEQVDEGLRAGIRYVLHAPALQAVLVRTGVFVVSGIAPVALLPVLTREELGLGPLGYGTLLGCFGAGAVLSTVSLPRVRKRVPIELLIAAATLVFAAMMVTLAHVRVVPVVGAALVVAGACWLVLMSTFNVGAQKAATAWVRGRALATFLLVFFGGMALGSAFWGEVATRLGISAALQAAALGLVVGLAAAARYRLTPVERLDVRPAEEPAELPSAQGPASAVPADPVLDLGPVLVQIEYRIEPTRAREFARAMQPVQLERRRNGATQWGLFSDPGTPGRYLESFLVESGAEYLRRRERVTVSDRAAEERALAFHIGDERPVTTHLVAEPAPE